MTRVASVVFSYFPQDPRPRREAEALIEAGMTVDMICLRGENQLPQEIDKGVNAFRINIRRKRHSKLRYLWQYGYFIVAAFSRLSLLQLRHRYDVVHVHNMPDVLVFCALLPRLMGARVILDLHDPVPELYMTKYGIEEHHPIIRIMTFVERLSIGFVHLVITPNIAFRKLFVARGCPKDKIHIVMNAPQEEIFLLPKAVENAAPEIGQDSFEVMYHGFIAEHNGLDIAVEAISLVREKIANIRFHIYGEGDFMEKVAEDIDALALKDAITCHGFLPLEEIAAAIGEVDLGIVPSKRTPFTELNFATRIFEYLCKGKPVIAPRTLGVLDYFDEASICLFEPGNPRDLARAIVELHGDARRRDELVHLGAQVYQDNRWELQKQVLVQLVSSLV